MADLANFQAVAVVDPNTGHAALIPNSDGSLSIGGKVGATLVNPLIGDATTQESVVFLLQGIRQSEQEIAGLLAQLLGVQLQILNVLGDNTVEVEDLDNPEIAETRN